MSGASHVIFLIVTAVGWAMIGHVVTKSAIHHRRRHRTPPLDPAQARLARIARLEIACGVGLKYGADALQGVATQFAESARFRSESDLQRFGGIIERLCWACGVEYKPSGHGDWYAQREAGAYWSMYGDHSNPNRDPLDETLCPACLANARAELDYGVPLDVSDS